MVLHDQSQAVASSVPCRLPKQILLRGWTCRCLLQLTCIGGLVLSNLPSRPPHLIALGANACRVRQDSCFPHPVRGADAQGALRAAQRHRHRRHLADARAGDADLRRCARPDEEPQPDPRCACSLQRCRGSFTVGLACRSANSNMDLSPAATCSLQRRTAAMADKQAVARVL